MSQLIARRQSPTNPQVPSNQLYRANSVPCGRDTDLAMPASSLIITPRPHQNQSPGRSSPYQFQNRVPNLRSPTWFNPSRISDSSCNLSSRTSKKISLAWCSQIIIIRWCQPRAVALTIHCRALLSPDSTVCLDRAPSEAASSWVIRWNYQKAKKIRSLWVKNPLIGVKNP